MAAAAAATFMSLVVIVAPAVDVAALFRTLGAADVFGSFDMLEVSDRESSTVAVGRCRGGAMLIWRQKELSAPAGTSNYVGNWTPIMLI